MRYRKDYACLDKSSSGEVISQRSRVRRLRFQRGVGPVIQGLEYDTFNIGVGSSNLPRLTSFCARTHGLPQQIRVQVFV